jgi:hypothetical protein
MPLAPVEARRNSPPSSNRSRQSTRKLVGRGSSADDEGNPFPARSLTTECPAAGDILSRPVPPQPKRDTFVMSHLAPTRNWRMTCLTTKCVRIPEIEGSATYESKTGDAVTDFRRATRACSTRTTQGRSRRPLGRVGRERIRSAQATGLDHFNHQFNSRFNPDDQLAGVASFHPILIR